MTSHLFTRNSFKICYRNWSVVDSSVVGVFVRWFVGLLLFGRWFMVGGRLVDVSKEIPQLLGYKVALTQN